MEFHKLEELRELLLAKIGPDKRLEAVARCNIEVNYKMRTTAGKANYTKNKIVLNGRLLTDNTFYIEHTFAHELAHLVSYALYGAVGAGHGRHWRSVMHTFGYAANRCHKLDTSKYARKHPVKGRAKCGCKVHDLKAKLFNNIQKGRKYKCLKCDIYLVLIGKVG